ncbi:MAG: primosomal protein N' [Alphaproteobacteria bacterium]|nr:primosomal protein N' [Alphaproteobacteria bacterium]
MGIFSVLVDAPAHSGLVGALDYTSEAVLQPGQLVRVPLGRREVLGVVWDASSSSDLQPESLREAKWICPDLPPLNTPWRRLIQFTAQYYQRSPGEVALQALPPQLRTLQAEQLQRRLNKLQKALPKPVDHGVTAWAPEPTPEQASVLAQLAQPTAKGHTHLLFGSTGSGKTEVYLRRMQEVLASDDQAQTLIMVPEINLTPQLEARVRDRFEPLYGAGCVVSMHSGMTPTQRLNAWLAAHWGRARIVLGTRLAVFASLPGLRLIVVDEEHDPSYKQQEGARYSARDLAVYRGHLEGIEVILGSATPSLESWFQSRPASEADPGGRYVRLAMPSRVGESVLPEIRCVDMRLMPKGTLFTPLLLDAMRERIDRGEQVMVLLNRRGWAPVLMCADCDWKSQCPQCSTYRVFHREDRTLRCHHCGLTHRVPRHCPGCGNLDLGWQGRGTEQLQAFLEQWFAQDAHPSGRSYGVMRMDADSTRLKGSLERQLSQVHAGEVDVLVGTQMIAKGHDFRRMGMVVVADPDGALFSSDFRAPERLFSLLLQAAGRAGRAAREPGAPPAQVWIQTRQPDHALFAALRRHDFPGFAAQQLQERLMAGMPPFTHQALVRAEARQLNDALAFLNAAREQGLDANNEHITLYPPVPMAMQKVANAERAQMLVESNHRAALQHFLALWAHTLYATRQQHRSVLRWAVDIDPQGI